MKSKVFLSQLELLMQVLPIALKDYRFALKGGTAINLFIRNYPRISVDIDLTYLPLEDRSLTFKNIHKILKTISIDIERQIPYTKVDSSIPLGEEREAKLFVRRKDIEIKIEPNYVLRGSIYGAEKMTLAPKVSQELKLKFDVPVLSFCDLYAGKICAALSRGHPRDFFDVKLLLENEGIDDKLMEVFLFYLISSNRPMIELLNPSKNDFSEVFNHEFYGMTDTGITIQELETTRDELIKEIKNKLSDRHKKLLLSVKTGTPDWSLSKIKDLQEYPSIKWKMFNLKKMNIRRRKELTKRLDDYLN